MTSAIEKLRRKMNKLIQLHKKDGGSMSAQGEYIYRRVRIGDGVYSIESTGIEIVRCRDCTKWATEKMFTGGCCGAKGDANPDGFCAWSERKAVHDGD